MPLTKETRKGNMTASTNKSVVRNKPDELLKIIKALERRSSKAVETLEALCDDEDPKVRHLAAKTILDTLKDMKDQVEKQDLQRILVQAKLNMSRPPNPADENTPQICFDTIQSV